MSSEEAAAALAPELELAPEGEAATPSASAPTEEDAGLVFAPAADAEQPAPAHDEATEIAAAAAAAAVDAAPLDAPALSAPAAEEEDVPRAVEAAAPARAAAAAAPAAAPPAPAAAAASPPLEPAAAVTYSPLAVSQAAAALPVFCPSDVARHGAQDDAWVSIAGVVFDVTPLLAPGGVKIPSDSELLIASAGTDVSRWFAPGGADVRTFVDPVTNLVSPYLPSGRLPHIPPTGRPTTDWAPPNAPPWWRNPALVVGRLSARPRRIRVVNTLTAHEHLLDVGGEQTIREIALKYLEYNAHAAGYTWKVLKPDYDNAILPLDMDKTLEENRVPDEAEEIERLGLDAEDNDLIPSVLLYYSDELTMA